MKRIILGLLMLLLIISVCPMVFAADESETTITEVEVGIPIEERPELFITRSMPTHGEGKIVVFLIDFPDYRNDNPLATQEFYDKIYFSGGFDFSWGSDSTVKGYYLEQSNGKLNLSGRVFDWYTAEHERSYYDNRKPELIIEAAEYYRAQGVDFSDFDGDGDGVIDSIVYHFAGEWSGSMDDPWYSGVEYSNGGQPCGKIGGLEFTTYIQVYENASEWSRSLLSTICHELGHSLGMPDLYSEVEAGMMPTNDLMSSNGEEVNPYIKMMLGWIDTVTVISGEVNDVKLMADRGYSEGVAIVTDEFNSFFDELFVIADRCTQAEVLPVIWHVDARINEDGTAFINENNIYTSRPDKKTSHSIENPSPYLFIEEIVSDPNMNLISGGSTSIEYYAFKEGSAFGKDLPSSDTHDGGHTGIVIDDFTRYKDYFTFDVHFDEDNSAPVAVTSEDELEFKETITLKFNEFVYKGDSFDQIAVLDADENKIDAAIIILYHTRNEIEITFKSDAYKKGYSIVIPDGALVDSSGNPVEKQKIVASNSLYFFPQDTAQLVGTGEFNRNNEYADFFLQSDSLVVITGLWEKSSTGIGYESDSRIEFMRLDLDGNVLTQTIVDSPFVNSNLIFVQETKDGNYILCFNKEGKNGYNRFLCIDKNGELKWVNDEYFNDRYRFYDNKKFVTSSGIVILFEELLGDNQYNRKFVSINSETGEIGDYELDAVMTAMHDLGNECFMIYELNDNIPTLSIIDGKTGEVIKSAEFDYKLRTELDINGVYPVDDGYIIHINTENLAIFEKRDLNLNLIKTVSRQKNNAYIEYPVIFDGDGFVDVEITYGGNHDNNQYHVIRYDKYLNMMWETDVVAAAVHYFKSDSGEIMAYRSMLLPERECYIDSYGNESTYKKEHIHTIEYFEAVEPTCEGKGNHEYWRCTGCGIYYVDSEGAVQITDAKELFISPTGHEMEIVPTVYPTCITPGTDVGEKCRVCGKLEGAFEELPPDPYFHKYEYVIVKEATCRTKGQRVQTCIYCGDEGEREDIPSNMDKHTPGEWKVIKSPTCAEAGEKTLKCLICSNTIERESIPVVDDHDSGIWRVVVEATAESEGEEQRSCTVCRKVLETRSIARLAPAESETTTNDGSETTADTTAGTTDTPAAGTTDTPSTSEQNGCSGTVGAGFVVIFILTSICGVSALNISDKKHK